jgi:hypothetical protein
MSHRSNPGRLLRFPVRAPASRVPGKRAPPVGTSSVALIAALTAVFAETSRVSLRSIHMPQPRSRLSSGGSQASGQRSRLGRTPKGQFCGLVSIISYGIVRH